MKPSNIFYVLDLSMRIKDSGGKFNPLFVGPPGIGKSEIVQQWCNSKKLPFIDIRAAYLEAPDLIGFPTVENINGRQVTKHNTPEFWPTDGKGVLLLEEPNRGTTSVMNTFMQLLTDGKVHNYVLPKNWIIVGCINPENLDYDVQTMDPALKNRFEMFEIEFDKKDFLQYAYENDWDKSLVNFIDVYWVYQKPEDVSKTPGNKYLSPRSFSKLNWAIKTGIDPIILKDVLYSILGSNYGEQYLAFSSTDRPVFYADFIKDYKAAIKQLKRYSDPNNYKNGQISITIRDIVSTSNNGIKIKDDLLYGICLALPSDQSIYLIKQLEYEKKDNGILERLFDQFPDLKKYLKGNLK